MPTIFMYMINFYKSLSTWTHKVNLRVRSGHCWWCYVIRRQSLTFGCNYCTDNVNNQNCSQLYLVPYSTITSTIIPNVCDWLYVLIASVLDSYRLLLSKNMCRSLHYFPEQLCRFTANMQLILLTWFMYPTMDNPYTLGWRKLFITGQAKFNPEYYSIKCVGSR